MDTVRNFNRASLNRSKLTGRRVSYTAMPSPLAKFFRQGGLDANGNLPEKLVSDGAGYPCRHCLCDIEKGREMRLFAWRPFRSNHAYAETGPVFICAEECATETIVNDMPRVLASRPQFVIRGYDVNERIVDNTGGVVAIDELEEKAGEILGHEEVVSVHVRSGVNTCYICSMTLVES